eukprot:1194789-Prorocentrum_minimum.AAC.5
MQGTAGSFFFGAYVHPEELLAVVKAAEVEPLPQQLHRGLRAVHLPRGHVDVVHKAHHALAHGGAQPGFALLLELGLDDLLRGERSGLRAEVDVEGHGVARELHLAQHVADDGRLAHPRHPAEQHRLVHRQQNLRP